MQFLSGSGEIPDDGIQRHIGTLLLNPAHSLLRKAYSLSKLFLG